VIWKRSLMGRSPTFKAVAISPPPAQPTVVQLAAKLPRLDDRNALAAVYRAHGGQGRKKGMKPAVAVGGSGANLPA